MDITAAPMDLVIKGVTYRAYPFRDRDHEEMGKWVRQEYLRRCKEATQNDPEMMKIALLEATTMVWTMGTGRHMVTTVAGAVKLANVMCHVTCISLDDIIDEDGSTIRSIFDMFAALHGIVPGIADSDEEKEEVRAEVTESSSKN